MLALSPTRKKGAHVFFQRHASFLFKKKKFACFPLLFVVARCLSMPVQTSTRFLNLRSLPPPTPTFFLALLRSLSLTLQISRVLNLEGGDLEAVKKKFSSSKFGSVASMKVNVLPDDLL